MPHLILMRHAKTEPWQEGMDDAARVLTERGRAEAAIVAAALARDGLMPDLVLVSGARRTRETWSRMAAAFPNARMRIEDGLYLADADEIAEIAQAAPETATVLIIGHNPGLHLLICDLLRTGSVALQEDATFLRERLPTGTAAVFARTEAGPMDLSGMCLDAVYWGRALAEREAGSAL